MIRALMLSLSLLSMHGAASAEPNSEARLDPTRWIGLVSTPEREVISKAIAASRLVEVARLKAAAGIVQGVSKQCNWPQELRLPALGSFNRATEQEIRKAGLQKGDTEDWGRVDATVSGWVEAQRSKSGFCDSPTAREARRYVTEHLEQVHAVEGNSYKSFDEQINLKYCFEFYNSVNDKTIRPILSSTKENNYSAVDMLSNPVCLPYKANVAKTFMPMFHYTAESPDNSYNYPKQLYEFFLKENNPDGFVQVVNSKNTLGQTFLDYLKYRLDTDRKTYISPEIEKKYISIFEYVCRRGGKFSYYRKTDCDSL